MSSKFPDLSLTHAGSVLHAKIQSGNGTALTITKIVAASGASDDPLALKGVVSPQQDFCITARRVHGSQATIEARLSNFPDADAPGLQEGYNLVQIGFYAIDPDAGEILYRISQFERPNWIPAFDERPWEYLPKFTFGIGDASDVNIEITPGSGVDAVQMDEAIQDALSNALQTHNTCPDAHEPIIQFLRDAQAQATHETTEAIQAVQDDLSKQIDALHTSLQNHTDKLSANLDERLGTLQMQFFTMQSRLLQVENAIKADITANPFLAGANVDEMLINRGVVHTALRRVEC